MKADASMIVFDYLGDTVVQQSSVERNLLIRSDDTGEYDILLRPLDTAMTSTDGRVSIPLENIYINNTHEDVYFRYNDYSNLFKRLQLNGGTKSVVAKIRDFGMVPAGTYNLNFEVQTLDSDTQAVVSMSTFMLQFVIPPTQDITFRGEDAEINVNAKDVFAKNKKIATDANPIIYINSNIDWVLLINTERFGEGAGNYYIRTVSASPAVTERLQERVQLYPDKEIVIARGKAPSSNEYVSIELAVEGKDGKIMKAGSYTNNLRLILREDRGR